MSSYSAYSDAGTDEQTRRKISSLEYTTTEHDQRLGRLESDTRDLDIRVDEVEREAERRHEELDDRLDDVAADLDEARTVIKGLTGRVQWLERHVRAVGDLTAIHLDTADQPLRQAAQRAERSLVSKAALLSPAQRTVAEQAITHHRNAIEQRDATLAAALEHAGTLADTPFHQAAHQQAVEDYRTTRVQLAAHSALVKQTQPTADQAQKMLDTDAQIRPGHAQKIMQGEAAWTQLRKRLRSRVSEAVAAGALLPVWFTTQLGWTPPADRTTEWVDTAVKLLAYRITYQITDPVAALGSRESAIEAGGHRATWYDELTREMGKLRSWP